MTGEFDDMRPETVSSASTVNPASVWAPSPPPPVYSTERAEHLRKDEESKPIPPRVRMAEPPEGKVPGNAARVAALLSGAGFEVRITYGVSGADRFGPERGICPVCGKVSGLRKDGTIRVHGPVKSRCESVDVQPDVTIPGEMLNPQESIAVRAKLFGAACWIDGSYEMGGYISDDRKRIIVCDWKEFYARVKQVCENAGKRSA
jgi:hypothetical protein